MVAFHNLARYVPQTLGSLRRNTHPRVEFVLVDDGSSDATPDLLESGLPTLPGARLVRHGRAGGVSHARNSGMAATDADWIAFLDGDDWSAPGHWPALLAAAERSGCDFVRTDHVRVEGRVRTPVLVPCGARDGRTVRPRDAILPVVRTSAVDYPFVWAGAYRRELYDHGALRFDERLRTAEDRAWTWQLHLAAERMAVVAAPGLFYRTDVTGSLTRVADERRIDFIPALDSVRELLADDPERERFEPKLLRNYCGMLAFHQLNPRQMPRSVRHSLYRKGAQRLRSFPPQMLAGVLAGMPESRRMAVEHVLRVTR